jgi:hypothetical protein
MTISFLIGVVRTLLLPCFIKQDSGDFGSPTQIVQD